MLPISPIRRRAFADKLHPIGRIGQPGEIDGTAAISAAFVTVASIIDRRSSLTAASAPGLSKQIGIL